VLETDNPVYKKYKDEKLTSNQFDLAYKNILEKNEKCQKRKPKPTHHLLIPFAEDMEKIENNWENNNIDFEKKIEQEMLKEFMENYVEDVEKVESNEKKLTNYYF